MKTKLILAFSAIVIALSACKKGKETDPEVIKPEVVKESNVYVCLLYTSRCV